MAHSKKGPKFVRNAIDSRPDYFFPRGTFSMSDFIQHGGYDERNELNNINRTMKSGDSVNIQFTSVGKYIYHFNPYP